MRFLKTTSLTLALALPIKKASSTSIIEIGNDPSQFNHGWKDGVCYLPLTVQPGDTLEFVYEGHDVHLLASKTHFEECNFTDAVLLAGVSESPFSYQISSDVLEEVGGVAVGRNGEEDNTNTTGTTLYFACGVGAHCSSGRQKLVVHVDQPNDDTEETPVSKFLMGVPAEACQAIQNGAELPGGPPSQNDPSMISTCTEPELRQDGRYHVSCLSPPATLTPGGVMNEIRMLHYPYPTHQRAVLGLRTWEFVSGDPDPEDGITGVTPVPVNQLYVHHLSGNVVLGQGTEGVRRNEPDAAFPPPFGLLTGNEGDAMIFHIIDLREVGDTWLECVECRCRHDNGTYIHTGTADGETGGVLCCSNCTDLAGPTVDYRMRYNVSYSFIEEEEVVEEVLQLTADISPAVGKNIEFDVPSWKYLPEGQRDPMDPKVQRLERVGPFNTLFKHDFFSRDYTGPQTIHILRCVGHLHIAAIGMWMEHAETGEVLCQGLGTHGTNPDSDEGFLIKIGVENFDKGERVIKEDTPVRLVTEYNATTLHTGVMGMWFVFVSGQREITQSDADLVIDVCTNPTCNATLLPSAPSTDEIIEQRNVCEDVLPSSPICKFVNLCTCEEFVAHEGSEGCGGMFRLFMGNDASPFQVPVDAMCRKHCGCPPLPEAPAAGGGGCADELNAHVACDVAGVCTCEALVNHQNTTGDGCGGVFSSDLVGDVHVNEVCGSYCNACEEFSILQEKKKVVLERIKQDFKTKCAYATEECRAALHNLYSCADMEVGNTLDGVVDPVVKSVVLAEGKRLALEHARLGHASLERFGPSEEEMEAAVMPCQVESVEDTAEENVTVGDAVATRLNDSSSGSRGRTWSRVATHAFSLFVTVMLLSACDGL